jgi:ubiquinol-cytochrome c reductase cytochrome c1 subunit
MRRVVGLSVRGWLATALAGAALVAGIAATGPVVAADHGPALAKQEWHHTGITGTFDRAELQRGFQVYSNVCAACHGLSLLSYRHLAGIGYGEAELKAIAAKVQVADGPNDQGEMFERPGLPSDRFKKPYPNDKASRAANGGALPPDLSLMVKARSGAEDYVYSLLTGYEPAPADVKVPEGQYYNKAFAGHLISMPPPLNEGAVSYADSTNATVPQMARDVTTFLAWAAEPTLEARKRMGAKVLVFLLVFAGLMYLVKKKIWSTVH